MEVYPNSIVIPPHEYRHVTLAFCPRALQQYSATFEAVAVGGAADPITAGFVCELRGEGALPSLNFQVGVGGVGSIIVALVACMPHCVETHRPDMIGVLGGVSWSRAGFASFTLCTKTQTHPSSTHTCSGLH